MNKKSFVFVAAIVLALVGCNKEKEVTTAVPGQEQQASAKVAVDNATPVANAPVVAPGSENKPA